MVALIPKVVPFPEVKTDDFFKQAALDILYILTNPSSTTMINLEDGDTARNPLLKITQALKRITTIPDLPNTIEPSLHPSTVPIKRPTKFPRVPVNNIQWNKEAELFKQTKYNLILRCYKSRASKHFLAHHIFNNQHIMQVYDTNGKRETVSSLLFGTDSKIRVRSIINELGRLSQRKKYGVKSTDKFYNKV